MKSAAGLAILAFVFAGVSMGRNQLRRLVIFRYQRRQEAGQKRRSASPESESGAWSENEPQGAHERARSTGR